MDCFCHKVRTDYTEVHKVLKEAHVSGQENISQRALSCESQGKKNPNSQHQAGILISPLKSDSIYGTPTCKPLILNITRTGSLKGKEEMTVGGWNYLLIFFFLVFNYVEIAEYQIKATDHLYLVKSAFLEICGVQQACKEAGEHVPSCLGTMLRDLPPRHHHPFLTLGWHTLTSKPSLRLPSAGKPARIRNFDYLNLIKRQLKSWGKDMGWTINWNIKIKAF